MKEFTVRYAYGNRWFESTVRTDSTASALIWAEKCMGCSNAYIVKWKDVEE